MSYRSSGGDVRVSEREREYYENEGERNDWRDRFSEGRFPDDRSYHRQRSPPREYQPQEDSGDESYYERRHGHEDRDRRSTYEDGIASGVRYRRRVSPPVSEFERKLASGKNVNRPSSRRRPGELLRRQSSLDTFDRRPRREYDEREDAYTATRREDVLRDDYRPPPYTPIPLPRSRALPPPRMYAERDQLDDISVPDRHQYPDVIREREVIRTRRRQRSRDSGATRRHSSAIRSSSRSSVRSSVPSTVSSSSSSSSGGTMVTAKSEYPKKGKTRIPRRLVSIKALVDLGYPFIEEGNTIIVHKALGQENIDDLLKLSQDYKRSDLELVIAKEPEVEEKRAEIVEVPVPAPAEVVMARVTPAPAQEVVEPNHVRDVSPARTHRSHRSRRSRRSRSVGPVVLQAVSPVKELVVTHRRRRSSSPSSDTLASEMAEIRLHDHGHGGELVRAERLPTGELVVYEERVEKIEAARRGVRIERNKRGRLSISVPKFR